MAISSERRISKHLKTLPVPVIHPPQPATALPEHSDIFLHNFNPGYFPFLPPWQLHLQHKPPPSPSMSLATLPSIPILISELRPRPFLLEDNWCNNSWLIQRLLTVLPFNWPFYFYVGKVYWYWLGYIGISAPSNREVATSPSKGRWVTLSLPRLVCCTAEQSFSSPWCTSLDSVLCNTISSLRLVWCQPRYTGGPPVEGADAFEAISMDKCTFMQQWWYDWW